MVIILTYAAMGFSIQLALLPLPEKWKKALDNKGLMEKGFR